MANFNSIRAVGVSLERFLTACFTDETVVGESLVETTAFLARTEDLKDDGDVIPRPAISILPYRVDFNKTMRAAWSAVGHQTGGSHLPLDVHLLLSAWASNAEHEYGILGRAMECLERFPILSGPMLASIGDWTPREAIQLVLEDVSTEAIMRMFDSMPADYRLSVPYIARVVRLDVPDAPQPFAEEIVEGIRPI